MKKSKPAVIGYRKRNNTTIATIFKAAKNILGEKGNCRIKANTIVIQFDGAEETLKALLEENKFFQPTKTAIAEYSLAFSKTRNKNEYKIKIKTTKLKTLSETITT